MSDTQPVSVVIVGGAIMGSFSARALRQTEISGTLTVVEKDPTYQFSSTALSAASIRTQFGTSASIQPPPERDADADGDFEPQHELLEESFWPLLAARISAMEELRLQRAWAGHYEVSTLDHNGQMHAPAVGRGVAELITTGGYRSIDSSPLGWSRIRTSAPLLKPLSTERTLR